MSRTRLLGAAVVIAVLAFGVLASNRATTARAVAPVGPDIHATGPGVVTVGNPINIALKTVGTIPPVVPWNAWNLGLVYSPSKTPFASAAATGPMPSPNCPAPPNPNDLTIPPPAGTQVLTWSCFTTSGDGSYFGPFVTATFTAALTGTTAYHMITPVDVPVPAACGSVCTYTASGLNGQELNPYFCDPSVPPPPSPLPSCGPIPVPGSTAADVVVTVLAPAPVLSVTKAFNPTSVVAGGQAFTITLGVSNAATPASTATNVTVTDTLPAAIPIANVTLPAGCTNTPALSQTVVCTVASLAPGASASFVLNVSATTPGSGGTSPTNCATAAASNTLPVPPSAPVTTNPCPALSIIPPAVAWTKSPASANVFIAENALPPSGGSFTFSEIMTNQGDTKGLGAFSFDLHWDTTQYLAPVLDFSPAQALFTAAGRSLTCTPSILLNGLYHVACVSTGPFGVGPSWVGPQTMVNVTLTLQPFVKQSIRPNKENGDLSWVKDDQVTVSNTCGQPLNDGSIQPLPGQPECQGLPLQGVGPGGVLTQPVSESVQTWRRLEGDVTKDCKVDIGDMQLEASKYGTSVGSLLYNVFYDVNTPLQRGDGEIDILDIQFVYGRNGSTCASPIPTQPAAALP